MSRNWQRHSTVLQQVPSGLRSWLSYPRSTTKRFLRHSADLRIDVLKNETILPHHSELQRLGLKARTRVHAREVMMYSDNTPCLLARTLMPLDFLAAGYRYFTQLGSSNVGKLLFNQAHVRRSAFDYLLLQAGQFEWQWANTHLPSALHSSPIYARRSRFFVQHHTLLMLEVFLPDVVSIP